MIASVTKADPPKLGWRIVRLFRPHRGTLALIVAMILITSGLSVIGALLVRRVFDDALFVRGGPDLRVRQPDRAVGLAKRLGGEHAYRADHDRLRRLPGTERRRLVLRLERDGERDPRRLRREPGRAL